jgi:DNA modification methylase
MSALVLRGDARRLPLPDTSVDLVITSPPYYALRSYEDAGAPYDGQVGAEATLDDYLQELWTATAEWIRVLKPHGSIWVNLGDKYGRGDRTQTDTNSGRKNGRGGPASCPATGRPKSLLGLPWRYALGCIDHLELTLRAEVIWSKPNALPESVTDRAGRAHETLFHFTLGERYYANLDPIREPHQNGSAARARAGYRDKRLIHAIGSGHRRVRELDTGYDVNPLGVIPRSVWDIPTEPLKIPDHLGVDHFAAFPTEIPRRIIAGWSPLAGVVADPFGGTGTTALVADVFGRAGITVDRSHDYCRVAQWRTTDPAERARAARVARPPVQSTGQLDLLDEAHA